MLSFLNQIDEIEWAMTMGDLLQKVSVVKKPIAENGEDFVKFLENTIVIGLKGTQLPSEIISERDIDCSRYIEEVVLVNIQQLLRAKKYHVQTYGFELDSRKLCSKDICSAHSVLVSGNYETLLSTYFGEEFTLKMLDEFVILHQIGGNSFQQITGPVLTELTKRVQGLAQPTQFQRRGARIQRNRMFYCTHSNKKPGLFHQSLLSQCISNKSLIKTKLLPHIFHYTNVLSIDAASKDRLLTILEKVVQNLSKLHKKQFSIVLNTFAPISPDLRIYKEIAKKLVSKVRSNTSFSQNGRNDPNGTPSSLNNSNINWKKTDSSNEMQNTITEMELELSTIPALMRKLILLNTSEEQVISFTTSLLKILIPRELLGEENTKILFKVIRSFIQLKRHESMSVEEASEKINFSKIPWLFQGFVSKKKEKNYHKLLSAQNGIKRAIVAWIMDDLVVDMLRANFYITEKHQEGSKVFFYRKPVWNAISKLGITKLQEDNLSVMKHYSDYDVKQSGMISLAKLRLIPKSDSVRPIMTYYKKMIQELRNGKKIKFNAQKHLLNCSVILKHLKVQLGNKFGYSVFENREVFEKYGKFAVQWENSGSPPLFHLIMDIQKCYDSIEIPLLMSMLERTKWIPQTSVISNFLILRRNGTHLLPKDPRSPDAKPPFRRFFTFRKRTIGQSLSDFKGTGGICYNEPTRNPNCPVIVIDCCNRTSLVKEEFLSRIKTICTNNIVRYGKSYFKQRKGVPQGLNISSVLSSYYYANLEESFLTELRRSYKDQLFLMMRLTDDYLILTDQEKVGLYILEQLLKCSEKFKFKFNFAKLKTNLNLASVIGVPSACYPHIEVSQSSGDSNMMIEEPVCAKIRWIGKEIDTRTLHIRQQNTTSDEEKIVSSINAMLRPYSFESQLKMKFKSFLLNNTLFYFNSEFNKADSLIEIFNDLIKVSVLKLKPFLTKVFTKDSLNDMKLSMRVAARLLEALYDFSVELELFMREDSIEETLIHIKSIYQIGQKILIDFLKKTRFKSLGKSLKLQYTKKLKVDLLKENYGIFV